MTASPAADWLPTGGKRPDLPEGTKIYFSQTEDGTIKQEGPTPCWHNFGWGVVTHYRLAPAQPAERAEATINAGATAAPAAEVSTESSVGIVHAQQSAPAPKRQNLIGATPGKTCRHGVYKASDGFHPCKECALIIAAGLEFPLTNATFNRVLAQRNPPPPLHRVTVERERIRFILAYKGRIPMTEEPRKSLKPLLASAFRVWK